MKAIALATFTLFAFNTWAADSTWLLCNDGKLALNVFEHRDANGTDRDTELTMIYGMHVYTATMSSDDPSSAPDKNGFQAIWINGPHEDQDYFSGQIKIDYQADTVMMKGTALFDGSQTQINDLLHCKEMTGNL